MAKVSTIRYRTGATITQTGIYSIHHEEHRLPHEVTLVSGHLFPQCIKCQKAVRFELVKAVSDSAIEPFHVALYLIPEVKEDRRETKKLA